jgi:nitroreductase
MDFYKAVESRLSIRSYKPDPVPDDVLGRILEAARIAPSAKNLQPWKFIVVKDPAVRAALVPACRGQAFIGDAPVVVCACAVEAEAWGNMGGYWKSEVVDVAIAVEHIVLAATAEGLGTCWVGAFLEEEVRKVLAIPAGVKPIALTPLGWPARSATPQPRKSLSEIICWERYC